MVQGRRLDLCGSDGRASELPGVAPASLLVYATPADRTEPVRTPQSSSTASRRPTPVGPSLAPQFLDRQRGTPLPSNSASPCGNGPTLRQASPTSCGAGPATQSVRCSDVAPPPSPASACCPGSQQIAGPSRRPPGSPATTMQSSPTPASGSPATVSVPWGAPFYIHPIQALGDFRQPIRQLQTRRLQRWTAIIGQCGTYRRTVAPDRLSLKIISFFD